MLTFVDNRCPRWRGADATEVDRELQKPICLGASLPALLLLPLDSGKSGNAKRNLHNGALQGTLAATTQSRLIGHL